MNTGNFVISLDFELMWGVRDKKTIKEYGENIKGVHQVIPRLLQCFDDFNVKATFATVGLLFFKTKEELLKNLPGQLPGYSNPLFSPYSGYFNTVGENFETDIYHFAPKLIKLIQKHPEHEIGTHTFSHYYCLEEGQTAEDFKYDIRAAKKIAAEYDVTLTSLVFPRNQFNNDYLKVCKEEGIICYRGNERSWLYEAKNAGMESSMRRAIRLIDAYINLSGYNCYSAADLKKTYPVNIPSSRFLRPWSQALRSFDKLRLRRITSAMSHAAKNNLTYHLWWHPHNFGANQEENFLFLMQILQHYKKLNLTYQFNSVTMTDLAVSLLKK